MQYALIFSYLFKGKLDKLRRKLEYEAGKILMNKPEDSIRNVLKFIDII